MLAAIPNNVVQMPNRTPQLEDGYTRLANDLLDALILARLTSRQWSVVMAVIRKTYGFNKKHDDIGLSQLQAMTRIDRANLSRTVRELVEMRILTRDKGVHGHMLGINKRSKDWVLSIQQPVVKTTTPGVAKTTTAPVAELATTKDNLPKDNLQKTNECAPQADRVAAKPARAGRTGRAMTAEMQLRFERFYQAYPRKRSRAVAEKAFAKLNPDDDLLETILEALDRQKRSPLFADPQYIPYPGVWLNNKRWLDEVQTEYTAQQRAVIAAYNAALGDELGHIDAGVFSESRAGRIDDFMTLSDKPEFWTRYFPYVRDNCDLPPGVGLDYLISREGFTKVKGGQHERKA